MISIFIQFSSISKYKDTVTIFWPTYTWNILYLTLNSVENCQNYKHSISYQKNITSYVIYVQTEAHHTPAHFYSMTIQMCSSLICCWLHMKQCPNGSSATFYDPTATNVRDIMLHLRNSFKTSSMTPYLLLPPCCNASAGETIYMERLNFIWYRAHRHWPQIFVI